MSKIISIASVPAQFHYTSVELIKFMETYIDNEVDLRKLKFLSKESGIESKYSAINDFKSIENPSLFKDPLHSPSTAERMAVFESKAPDLVFAAANQVIENAAIQRNEITDIITVSCTGMSAPGLEIALSERLGLNDSVNRHAINFMGCYAAFHGLRLGDLICKANPKAKVLLVCVELCSIHFQNDGSDDNLLSTTLFSDGAAAVILASESSKNGIASISGFHTMLIPKGKSDMAWRIGNNGFEMKLNRNVPKHIQSSMATAFEQTLAKASCERSFIQSFAIHPGGKNVLFAFAKALGIEPSQLDYSFEVLRDYGNMSSCSILFVLERMLKTVPSNQGIYAAAFGPGLTVESAILKSING